MDGPATQLDELARLVAQLEATGRARDDREAQALLEASRRALALARIGLPHRPAPRPAAKLAIAARGVLDLAMACAAVAAVVLEPVFLAIPALWLLWRLRRQAWRLEEAALWSWDGLAQGADWYGEAFSRRAAARYEARWVGARILAEWRRHRREEDGRATVEGFLQGRFGARVARSWRDHGAALSGRPRVRWEARRPSALRRGFAALVRAGAFWPEPEPAPAPPPPPPPREPPPDTHRQARSDLADRIKRKRAEIDQVHRWKLKTPAEFAQRDARLAELRAEVAALEAELRALPPPGAA